MAVTHSLYLSLTLFFLLPPFSLLSLSFLYLSWCFIRFNGSGASSTRERASERASPMPRKGLLWRDIAGGATVPRKRDGVPRDRASWFPSRCSAEIDVSTATNTRATHDRQLGPDKRAMRAPASSPRASQSDTRNYTHNNMYNRTDIYPHHRTQCDCNKASDSWLCSMFL